MRVGLWGLVLMACATPPERRAQEIAPARNYCELSADAFCAYYLRCDRMAVADHGACVAAFSEGCEAQFEPHYAALEDRGDLALSVPGLGACAEHLRTVDCADQIFDLDGGCGEVWQGLAPAGAACGPGIDSFVCGAESTCVLGLDFCGTCEPTVPAGSACGPGVRCAANTSCIDGSCVSDAGVGEACGEAQDCRLGAFCEDGVCARNAIVAVGDACDVRHRCPYVSACVGGTCVQAVPLGSACSETTPCASGWCGDGTCTAPQSGGAACETGRACLSGVCDQGVCRSLPGVCFE